MTSIGAFEAKNKLASLLDRAQKGEQIVITKRGVPIAVLGPIERSVSKPPQDAIAAIREFRRGKTLNGLSVRELIDAGRH